MADYIDRQATIDKINERQRKLIYCFGFENDAVKIMDIAKSIVIAIPSAQPEIQPADVIPIKWIQKKIDKSIGMEHAMWSKLLRMWENEQLRKYVRNLKDDNK